MNKPTLTLMCGLPRSGKSTWIKENKGNSIVVSTDDIRKEIFGHQFHAPANKFVFGITEGMATLILKQGRDVIVDATHITRMLRQSWKSIAKNCNSKLQVVWVYTDYDPIKNFANCLERNQLSPKNEKVPLLSMFNMAYFFEKPTFEELYCELIEYKSEHTRKLPENQRIKINKYEDFRTLMEKGERLWGADVVEEKEKDF
jgi:predicted kinase